MEYNITVSEEQSNFLDELQAGKIIKFPKSFGGVTIQIVNRIEFDGYTPGRIFYQNVDSNSFEPFSWHKDRNYYPCQTFTSMLDWFKGGYKLINNEEDNWHDTSF